MPDARLDIEFDVETGRAEPYCRKRRGGGGDRRVGLTVHEKDRRGLACRRDGLRREKPSEGNECADLLATGDDRLEGNDRTVRDTDEGDPVRRFCESFPAGDVDDQAALPSFASEARPKSK